MWIKVPQQLGLDVIYKEVWYNGSTFCPLSTEASRGGRNIGYKENLCYGDKVLDLHCHLQDSFMIYDIWNISDSWLFLILRHVEK